MMQCCVKSMVINSKLYVAIADVSSFVSHNGHIDKQAFQRATSVYFPGFVVPMLPHRLADDLCSLKPNVKRRTLACEINLTQVAKSNHLNFTLRSLSQKNVILTLKSIKYYKKWLEGDSRKKIH